MRWMRLHLFPIAATLAAIAAIGATALSAIIAQQHRHNEALLYLADQLAEAYRNSLLAGEYRDFVARLREHHEVADVKILDAQCHSVLDTSAVPDCWTVGRSIRVAPAVLWTSRPIFFDDMRRELHVYVYLAFHAAPLSRAQQDIIGVSLFVAVLVTVAVAVIHWSSIRRLRRLVEWTAHCIGRIETSCVEETERTIAAYPEPLQMIVREAVLHAQALTQARSQLEASSREAAVGRIAHQVAHDIRSPLTALKVAVGHVRGVAEEQRVMMRNAVQRIEDIANDLAARKAVGAAPADGPTVHLMSSLVETLISEKRTHYRGHYGVRIEAQLDESTYGLFARVVAVEFNRLLSNLVNNGVEALAGSGVVTVAMCRDGEALAIRVTDTGQGIPPDVLPRLMQRGVTVGKASGSGLGLYHARATVEGWGGSVELVSTVGMGTTVTIRLPLAPAPEWFVPDLVIPGGGVVVIIDDDSSIHQVWEERCAQLALVRNGTMLQHFSSSGEALQWTPPTTSCLYLCDYELLGEPSNGLDLIERLGVAEQAVLVTSRYEDPAIQQRCVQLGVRLLPKGLAGLVPMRVAEVVADDAPPIPECSPSASSAACSANGPRILVIDDDSGIRFAWTIAAEDFGVAELTTFESMEACETAAPAYDQFDVAFVDKHIPESAWPIDRALVYLKQAGVHRVVVASGENLTDLQSDPRCAAADGFVAGKIPEDLAPYLVPPAEPVFSQAATG